MATEHYARNMLVSAKVNASTYGTDATPTAASNAILVSDFQATPYDAQTAQRNTTQPFKGGRQRITWGAFARCTFKFELQGSGTNNVAPAWGPLMQGCGFAETARSGASGTIGDKIAIGAVDGAFTYAKTTAFAGTAQRTVTLECTTGGGSGTAEFTVSAPAAGDQTAYSETGEVMTDATAFDLGGSAQITPTIGTDFSIGDIWEIELFPVRTEYNPVSTGEKDISLYYYFDGFLQKITGARGNLQLTIEPGLPMATCSFTGLFNDPTDTALPSDEVFTSWAQPDPATPDTVVMAQLHRFDARFQSFSLDMGNKTDPRRLVNHYSVPMRDRDVTGRFNWEMDTLAAFNPIAAAKANTLSRFKMQHGAATGRIVGLHAEACQILAPSFQTVDDILHWQADLAFVPTNGNDDLVIYTA